MNLTRCLQYQLAWLLGRVKNIVTLFMPPFFTPSPVLFVYNKTAKHFNHFLTHHTLPVRVVSREPVSRGVKERLQVTFNTHQACSFSSF